MFTGSIEKVSPKQSSVFVSFITFVPLVWGMVCVRICTIPHTTYPTSVQYHLMSYALVMVVVVLPALEL